MENLENTKDYISLWDDPAKALKEICVAPLMDQYETARFR